MQQYLKQYLLFFTIVFISLNSNAQFKKTSKWKALFAAGINYPTTDGFVSGSYAQPINFPTVNLGVQHMLKSNYGVKLDYGFNRFKSDKDTPDFKINYSRINAQFVYDPSGFIGFLPNRLRTILHAGPGISFVKPLANLKDNKQTYMNLLGGLEVHYAINEKVSIYTDVAYIYGLTSLDKYDPVISGLGAFNGSVFNLTFGVAVSLSGCQFCD
ncbi:cell envelope biogenesis protein OmpA [Winogradskyella echinorum]|uniref:Cell envelope biogenesis protein OmpA n=1 Tax=Winogradskyella echinorum TaxID=538189 RepID=A0ABR6XY20_9FLAO|nr:cell envelope biogenesis protein OmpA [Winogradskyella echinorum]MBC3845393.1 cell envelope biogenesis protein OmpA [Winogradskyella echinorum]MBC5749741.1 cell envelope biogenesis protein OmpA [Winogradskyella echinorum]